MASVSSLHDFQYLLILELHFCEPCARKHLPHHFFLSSYRLGSDMAFLSDGHGFYILESYLYSRREISKFTFFDLNTILLLVFVHRLMKSEVDI